jgi:hypothetical protein
VSSTPARAFLFALLVATTAGPACGSIAESPTSPSTPSLTRDVFEGTIPAAGSSFYSFTVVEAGAVHLTLVSLAMDASRSTVSVSMGLGIGIPNGAGCDLTMSVIAAPALVSHLTVPMGAGSYCTELFDVGNLTTPVRFAVRIVHS